MSTASSIEYGRGVSTRNPTFTRNPNFDKLKNPPKEKNMAEYGWGNVEDLEKSAIESNYMFNPISLTHLYEF